MGGPAVTAPQLEQRIPGPDPGPKPGGFNRSDWRRMRYAMRRRAQGLAHRGRISRCGLPLYTPAGDLADRQLFDFPLPPQAADVELWRRGDRAEYRGLQTCGSPWECPICAEKLARKNGQLLTAGARVIRRRGGEVYSIAFTIRHKATSALAPNEKLIGLAWRKVQAGEPWKRARARYGIQGYARAPEVTHGDNGFHPHLHVGLFVRRRLEKCELEQFQDWLSTRWRRILVRLGVDPKELPTFSRGVKIRKLHKDDYLAKFGLGGELAKGHVKRAEKQHRTPWQILYDLTTGQARRSDVWLWREYAAAMFRERPLTWSKGLRLELEVDLEVELMRQEDDGAARLAGDRPEPELVLRIDGRSWIRDVLGQDLESELVELAEAGRSPDALLAHYRDRTGRSPPLRLAPDDDPDALPFDF